MAKTDTPKVLIFNMETGEEILRDANAEELAQIESDKAATLALEISKAQKAADRAALLAQLGITEEQAKLLLA